MEVILTVHDDFELELDKAGHVIALQLTDAGLAKVACFSVAGRPDRVNLSIVGDQILVTEYGGVRRITEN